MLSKTTTLILSVFMAIFISTPLAFAGSTKVMSRKTAGLGGASDRTYARSKLSQKTTLSKISQLTALVDAQKYQPRVDSMYPDAGPGDQIADLAWEYMDGWSTATGDLIGLDHQPVSLLIEVDPQGNGEIRLDRASGLVYHAILNQNRMKIISEEAGGTATEVWSRPGGGLLDFLDSKAENDDFQTGHRQLQGVPHHETARTAVNEIAREAGGAFQTFAERLKTAETVYTVWKEATAPEPEQVKYATQPVPIEPKGPPVLSCTYPNEKTASATENTLNILKLAKLNVKSAKVKVSAFCEDRGGCLKAESKVKFGSVGNKDGDGSNGCPQNGTEISGEEFKVGIVTFDASAEVGRGCALNYDNTDVAEAFSAEILVDGVVEASFKGTEDKGDGVAGKSTIEGTAVVCYEDDPYFDDVQNVMLWGTAHSILE